jgi:hypothetical protein
MDDINKQESQNRTETIKVVEKKKTQHYQNWRRPENTVTSMQEGEFIDSEN